MLSKLRRRAESEKGFTLIELLVVILIIGILAAIAIPAFLNQRNKAYDSAAKSNVRTAATAEETYATDNNGSYSADVTGKGKSGPLTTIEPSLANDPGVTATLPAGGGYQLVSSSGGANSVTYTLVQLNGTVTRTCAPVSTGSCPAAGTW